MRESPTSRTSCVMYYTKRGVYGSANAYEVATAEEDETQLVAVANDQTGKTKAKRRARKREAKGSEGEVTVAEVE